MISLFATNQSAALVYSHTQFLFFHFPFLSCLFHSLPFYLLLFFFCFSFSFTHSDLATILTDFLFVYFFLFSYLFIHCVSTVDRIRTSRPSAKYELFVVYSHPQLPHIYLASPATFSVCVLSYV